MKKLLYLFIAALLLSATDHHSPVVRTGQDRALFIAVNDYRHAGLSDLQNPIKNATDIAGELYQRFGFDTLVLRNPTLVQIEQKLNEYRDKYARNLDNRYPSDGQLLIFFSGHGKEYYGDGYFLPSDADPSVPHRTGLGYIFLRNLINEINCNHILVAVDACYSANFDPDKGNKPDNAFKRIGELSEVEKTLQNHRQYKARLFFTSDAVGDMTPDRSNFARKMLEGLDAFQSPAGFMTSSELFANFIQKASPTPRGGNFGDDDVRSAFLFFHEKKTAPAVNPVQDLRAWEEAQNVNTMAAYRTYLVRFPRGEFRLLAEQRIAQLEDYEAWQRAKAADTKAAYERYLTDYPFGAYGELAEAALKGEALINDSLTPSFNDPSTGEQPAPSDMVFVEGGTFTMGCTEEQGGKCNHDEEPAHQVTVKSVFMGKFEVTNAEFCVFLNAKGNQSEEGSEWLNINCGIEQKDGGFVPISGKEKHPVDCVTWYGARAYCAWLSEETGKSYRLPTEAEWEYAARGGLNSQSTIYAGGSKLKEVGWYTSNAGGSPQTVGQKKANELGVFDMSGNVWEWCQDYWNDSYEGAPSNGEAWLSGDSTLRVLRGGALNTNSWNCRVSRRVGRKASHRNFHGFRLVQDLD